MNSNQHAQRYKHQNWIAWGVAWADPLSASLLIGRFSGQILVARLWLINLRSSLSGHPPGHGTTLDLLSICLFITHPFIAFNYCTDAASAKNQSALLNWKQPITCRVNTSGVLRYCNPKMMTLWTFLWIRKHSVWPNSKVFTDTFGTQKWYAVGPPSVGYSRLPLPRPRPES